MSAAGFLDWDEMKKLVVEMDAQINPDKIKPSTGRTSLMIHLGCYVALRVSDLLGLKWDDLSHGNIIHDKLTLREKKTGKIRTITLHPDIKKHLLRFKKLHSNPDGFIFQGRNGAAVSSRFANYELERVRIRYGLHISKLSTHAFRKTWARHLWEASGRNPGTLEMISIALNHSSISNTRIYLGITESEISGLYLSV